MRMRRASAEALARDDVVIGRPSGVVINPTSVSSLMRPRIRDRLEGLGCSPGAVGLAGSKWHSSARLNLRTEPHFSMTRARMIQYRRTEESFNCGHSGTQSDRLEV